MWAQHKNNKNNKLFYANQRLDFRGITDAAGTTFNKANKRNEYYLQLTS